MDIIWIDGNGADIYRAIEGLSTRGHEIRDGSPIRFRQGDVGPSPQSAAGRPQQHRGVAKFVVIWEDGERADPTGERGCIGIHRAGEVGLKRGGPNRYPRGGRGAILECYENR